MAKHFETVGKPVFEGIDGGILDASMTIDDLVTLVSRETTHTARQVEGRLLTLINSMFANWTAEEDE